MLEATDVSAHFAFGENWADYAKLIDEPRIAQATEDVRRLLGDLSGKSFLDIGCGSGLHALAAARLGAARVVAVDVDPKSVETAQRVLAGLAIPLDVRAVSVFDLPDEQFDAVYSWGVLHHTGAMHEAMRKAARLVRPEGLFAFALYRKTPACAAWKVEKRIYANAPRTMQHILRGLYVAAYAAALTLTGRSFRARVRQYQNARGMSFFHDVHDWLGGYPYESISPREVTAEMEVLGFARVREFVEPPGLGLFGSGCDEYVYRKLAQPDPFQTTPPGRLQT
jgi:2-polyprenyl-3-methyl-5-hydroxy-6-metoxy-1,4-benzoquinol methylase